MQEFAKDESENQGLFFLVSFSLLFDKIPGFKETSFQIGIMQCFLKEVAFSPIELIGFCLFVGIFFVEIKKCPVIGTLGRERDTVRLQVCHRVS